MRPIALGLLTAWLPLAMVSPAFALETASDAALPATGAGDTNGGLDEIVVTAQRKSENILRVPVTMSVATGEQLVNAGINDISSLQFTTPGFYTDNGVGYTQIYIRGIGNNIFVGADPSVVTNIDDVPRIYGSLVNNFVNVERVEVLKGAQGGLYGRNATGGVVNIITRQPSSTFESDARLSYGTKNTLQAALYVNLPINDVIAWNVSFERDSHDNYVKNNLKPNPLTAAMFPDGGGPVLGSAGVVTPAQTAAFFNSSINPQGGYGNEDFWSGDTKLRLQLAENLKITVDADWSEKHDSNGNQWFLTSPGYSQATDAAILGQFGVVTNFPPGFFKPATSSFTTYNSTGAAAWLTDYGVSLKPEWNLTGVDLTNISSFRQQQTFYAQNYAHPLTVDVPLVQVSKWYLYEELRAASTDLGPFHLIGGATYLKDHILGKTTNLLFPPLYTVPIPAITAATNTFVESTDLVENWSVYLQAGYDITSKINFTASGRYIHETNNALFTNPVTSASSIDAKKFLPSATLSYALDGGGNIYARYAKGFKAGGVNPVVPPDFFPTDFGKVFGPEQVDTYEVGFKNEMFDHHVQVTSAVFYNAYNGLQYTTNGNEAHPALIEAIINAGTAETYGVEGSATWRVNQPLTLSANVGYLEAKYLTFQNTDASVLNAFNFSGNRMINAPRWQMGFNAGLDQPITGNLHLTGTWLTAYTSDVTTAYTTFPGLPNGDIPQYWITNVRVGVKTDDDRYAVSVFVNNAFDRAYYTFNSISGLGGDAVWGNPRIIGAEVHVKFH